MSFNIKLFVKEITELKKKEQFRKAELLLEEKLKKYPRNIFLINSLIEVCLDTRFDRSVGLLNTAIKLGIADSVTYTIMLKKYMEMNDTVSVQHFFNKCNTYNKADTLLCNDIIHFYMKNQMFDDAKSLYEKLVKNNTANSHTYGIMLTQLYKYERYIDGLEILYYMPPQYKDDFVVTVTEIELNRKMKNYEICLDLISKINLGKINDERKTTIKTIKAYCLKDMGKINDAYNLFHELYINTNPEDACYIRIVCGYVFCECIKSHEIKKLKEILTHAKQQNKGNTHDVNQALKLIEEKLILNN